MSGKEGTSKRLPAGLTFCQYCRTIESEAAPQRFLSWRTKGTSSQNPGASGSALSATPRNEVRLQANNSRCPVIWKSLRVVSILRCNGLLSSWSPAQVRKRMTSTAESETRHSNPGLKDLGTASGNDDNQDDDCRRQRDQDISDFLIAQRTRGNVAFYLATLRCQPA